MDGSDYIGFHSEKGCCILKCGSFFVCGEAVHWGGWRDLGTDDRFRLNVLHGFDGFRLVLGTDSRFRRNVLHGFDGFRPILGTDSRS